MIRKIGLFLIASAWFVAVFLIGLRVTFPTGVLAERVSYEVHERTDGEYVLKMSSLAPWRVGLSAENVVLSQVVGSRQAPELTPLFVAEGVAVRAGPFSLLGKTPSLVGQLTMAGGSADFTTTLLRTKRGEVKVIDGTVEGEGLPLADLLSMAGQEFTGSGEVDVELEMASEDGEMSSVNGEIEVNGRNVLITDADVTALAGMPLGRDVPVEELEIEVEVSEGKATIKKALLRSSYAGEIRVEGEVELRTPLTRSTLQLDIEGELGEELAMFKSFFKDATNDKGQIVYEVTGTIGRPYPRGKGVRVRSLPSRGVSREGVVGRLNPDGIKSTVDVEKAREEREKRRQELRERLRTGRSGVSAKRPSASLESEEFEDDEEEYEDDEEGEQDVEYGDEEGEF